MKTILFKTLGLMFLLATLVPSNSHALGRAYGVSYVVQSVSNGVLNTRQINVVCTVQRGNTINYEREKARTTFIASTGGYYSPQVIEWFNRPGLADYSAFCSRY